MNWKSNKVYCTKTIVRNGQETFIKDHIYSIESTTGIGIIIMNENNNPEGFWLLESNNDINDVYFQNHFMFLDEIRKLKLNELQNR